MRKTFSHILLIIILGIIIYSNTLHSPFIGDDQWLIGENRNIRDLSNFIDCSGTRYLTYLSFALNYWIHGYDVRGYHIFNITVHILNAILIYLLVTVIFKTPYFLPPFNSSHGKEGFRGVALISSLVFISHPVHTFAVTNINQRSVLLTTFFYLSAIAGKIALRARKVLP